METTHCAPASSLHLVRTNHSIAAMFEYHSDSVKLRLTEREYPTKVNLNQLGCAGFDLIRVCPAFLNAQILISMTQAQGVQCSDLDMFQSLKTETYAIALPTSARRFWPWMAVRHRSISHQDPAARETFAIRADTKAFAVRVFPVLATSSTHVCSTIN